MLLTVIGVGSRLHQQDHEPEDLTASPPAIIELIDDPIKIPSRGASGVKIKLESEIVDDDRKRKRSSPKKSCKRLKMDDDDNEE